MEIQFLGTGSAWSLPEHSCRCAICARMTELGEERTRTSFVVRSREETVLVDCGPDLGVQMRRNQLGRPDLIIITHEHGDHYLGMDDLLVFRRSMPKAEWEPIPVYATERAWREIEVRFGYLLGSLLEKRFAFVGVPLDGPKMRITPFKTFHGPFAEGSAGYVIEAEEAQRSIRVVYTSDFMNLESEPDILFEPDVLIIQSHWLNEPVENRPSHMSFQKALDYIKRWKPKKAAYLIHISDGDAVPGDPCNDFLKKCEAAEPLADPLSQVPYPVPRCQSEWQQAVNRIGSDYKISTPIIVARDGLLVVV